MQRYKFSELSRELVGRLVDLRESEGEVSWQPAIAALSDDDQYFAAHLKKKLRGESLEKVNEATVWSKAIYPLLDQAETNFFTAWSQVELSAEFREFVLEGIADGVVGKQKIGYLSTPFLVVIEAKKKLEARDPQPQLYGAMLAAAKLNWSENRDDPQEIYGCYTIGDSWTFLRGKLEAIEAEKNIFNVESSREYVERFEADIILGILKFITAEHEQN